MEMKPFTRGRLNSLMSKTEKCYHEACKKAGYSNVTLNRSIVEWEITYEEATQLSEKLDEIYRELLCELPSKILEDIVTAANTGQQRRAKKTIDTITTELIERELRKDEK